MAKRQISAHQTTLDQFVRAQFIKQAVIHAALLLIMSLVVVIMSVKLSTDQHAKSVCHGLSKKARYLIQTEKYDYGKETHQFAIEKVEKSLGIHSLSIVDRLEDGFLSYEVAKDCQIGWQNASQTNVMVPVHWGAHDYYLSAIMSAEYIHGDLLMLIVAVYLCMFASYFLAGRSMLQKVKEKISKPINAIWQGIHSDKAPIDLSLKELADLWQSLLEFKEISKTKERAMIAKLYFHQLKAPSYFFYNQLMKLSLENDPQKIHEKLKASLQEGDLVLKKMEKRAKKIATDDFGRYATKVDFTNLIRQQDPNFQPTRATYINGDKDLFDDLLQNLYSNAVEACGSIQQVATHLEESGDKIIFSVSNPVADGVSVDTEKFFQYRYTTKEKGHGLGLNFCVNTALHYGGNIEAFFCEKKRKITIKLTLTKKWQPS